MPRDACVVQIGEKRRRLALRMRTRPTENASNIDAALGNSDVGACGDAAPLAAAEGSDSASAAAPEPGAASRAE